MTVRIKSASIVGVQAHEVGVETHVISALRKFSLVGLPDGVVREAKDRVRCAIENSGYSFPNGEVVVNLSPAALPKSGAGFDLAVALGVIGVAGHFDIEYAQSFFVYGELALDGRLESVPGALSVARLASRMGVDYVMLPSASARAAAYVDGITILRVDSLVEAVAILQKKLSPRIQRKTSVTGVRSTCDFSDVVGQMGVKRALEVSAGGGHNLLMIGPPGSGKSMMARRLPSIMPEMTAQEILEVSEIYSSSRMSESRGSSELVRTRPFRSPHHSMSVASLLGGGSQPMPGEISLAHRGVLFLDEILEIRRQALEGLREPLEDRRVSIARVAHRVVYPADFILLAAMNPCPCGKRGSYEGKRAQVSRCHCSALAIQRYVSKISGPICDRIDLQVWVPAVPIDSLHGLPADDQTDVMRERVSRARKAQLERYQDESKLNIHMSTKEIREHCVLESTAERPIKQAAEDNRMSARAYTRLLKVARTIADLDGASRIGIQHVSEALAYRVKELA
jgi:magnesium chelatase family protein